MIIINTGMAVPMFSRLMAEFIVLGKVISSPTAEDSPPGPCREMAERVGISWAFSWLDEIRLQANGFFMHSITYFPNELDMHYVTDCNAQ